MASSQNVELEAAKFLQKLIHESKDEPAKLATKLYVILQHMKSSGKEHSMPYQVISRAMETVINQHGLDIEALKSSRLPLSSGSQTGDCTTSRHTESLQAAGISANTNAGMAEHDVSKSSPFAPGRAVAGPSSGGHENYQGSLTHRSNQSLDQESPSSLDNRSANSQSQERRDSAGYAKQGNQKDSKKVDPKRKRGDSLRGMEPHMENLQKLDGNNIPNARKGKMSKVDSAGASLRGVDQSNFSVAQSMNQMEHLPSSLRVKPEDQIQSSSSKYDNHGLAPRIHEQRNIDPFMSAGSSSFEQSDDGRNALNQETSRNAAVRDIGKSLVSRASAVPGTPFNEQQLKQLRAQCLVFLAFRNGLTPKPLHLEIALGNIFAREGNALGGVRQEPDQKGNLQPLNEPSKLPDPVMAFGRGNNVREAEKILPGFSPAGSHPATHLSAVEAKDPTMMDNNRNYGIEVQNQTVEPQTIPPSELKYLNSSSSMNLAASNGLGNLGRDHLHGIKTSLPSGQATMNQQVNLESFKQTSFGGISEAPGGSSVSTSVREHWKPVSGINSERQIVTGMDSYNEMPREVPHEKSREEEEQDESASIFLPPPKYTMLEKWVMDRQKKKFLMEQNQLLKQQKTEQRIASCYDRLKKTVSVSDDISAKTKSVIELKKLQLLTLQRRLRGDFLGDFFKPILTDMDNLRSFKKHRHGRRIKQIEKYEQKMKEERQKRTRERQKEFFTDIEVHKERLEDVFKAKRERVKGFNKYVKELHKKKERIHREKIDRIQREKITLLKINDVEGYLRMVQDAKSDRVKQLLKETEKYLQKLGSKLREAKAAATFDNDADEIQTASFLENSEAVVENEDESDQAKHYKESNEKYYLMAHSVKESIAEQPPMLHGGKLREYQMNGLRWLVSLYNNHLNGILADEMGLGKTVQVISLICYLMENKNDRGPFLVVVPSSVLPGWESEINFWAPAIHKIVYAGPPEERRRLFKEKIVHQKFNVLLTTYEYLMNKHDRPKLSKLHWHYIIIDEGHRIKNASCKLNADLKHYRSSHRLLLTGTPLQNNLEELWALLNFLLPNIFNSSEDFSQWFNKPFESTGDTSAEAALLSEEENLLIINRLHQVLRPFVLRRLKHKVENELPEKIERLIRCEPSAYQKLLMKRVEENLGSLGTSKARSVQNSVMELRNICNHPYISQLHAEQVDHLIPKHYLPPIIRLCGKLEMLDRLLPKLKATDHRVLFFSTMTRLLDVMEEYLSLKHYRYLRLDGHTSGGDRGALIDAFNKLNSPFFIFLLSIRAGGVGVNLQAADTVIIFDTDWNPQVDLQAQARAHRIGQKKDVLVLRFETVQTVEEQVRAAAEHKLGVANQSITAGFFDNNTSAEDRREYLETLLRECKKEEDAPVLDDDALNDLIARREEEIDIFESIDKKRHEEEMEMWGKLVKEQGKDGSEPVSQLPSRLVTDEDLKMFNEAMKVYETPKTGQASNVGVKRKSGYGGLDTQHYGRGKRAREVRSYEEQMTEEEFEKICQVESPGSPNQEGKTNLPTKAIEPVSVGKPVESPPPPTDLPTSASTLPSPQPSTDQVTPPARRGRGRPKRAIANISPSVVPGQSSPGTGQINVEPQKGTISNWQRDSALNPSPALTSDEGSVTMAPNNPVAGVTTSAQPNPPVASPPGSQAAVSSPTVPLQEKGSKRKSRMQASRDVITTHNPIAGLTSNSQPSTLLASSAPASQPTTVLASSPTPTHERGQRRRGQGRAEATPVTGVASKVHLNPPMASPTTASQPSLSSTALATQEKPAVAIQERGRRRKTQSPVTQSPVEAPRRRGRRRSSAIDSIPGVTSQVLKASEHLQNKPVNSLGVEGTAAIGSVGSAITPEYTSAGHISCITTGKEEDNPHGSTEGTRERVCGLPAPPSSSQDSKPIVSDNSIKGKQSPSSKIGHNVRYVASMMKEILSASKSKVGERSEGDTRDSQPLSVSASISSELTGVKQSEDKERSFNSDGAAANLPSGSKDHQFGEEVTALHEKVEKKAALSLPKQVIDESLEEMPALPPGFETPKRLLPQDQEGESSDHGATNVQSVPPLPSNVAEDVRTCETSADKMKSAILDTETVTSGANGKSLEVIDSVLNQELSSRADVGKNSSNHFVLESKTEALHAAKGVEQNNDEFSERVPSSGGESHGHPAAPGEPHGGIVQLPMDENSDVNLEDHDVMVQYDKEKVSSQQDLTDVTLTGEADIDGRDRTSPGLEEDFAGQQPHGVGNSGADLTEFQSRSHSPKVRESVDKLFDTDTVLSEEKGGASSSIKVTESEKDEEGASHLMDISSNVGISMDMEESCDIAEQQAAGPVESSSSLLAHEAKSECPSEKAAIGSSLHEEGRNMDDSQANPESGNNVSENIKEKSAMADDSVAIIALPPPLAEGEKNDCLMGGEADGNLLHEMGAEMDVFEQSNPETVCEAPIDESAAIRDSNVITSMPDSLDMAEPQSRNGISESEENQLALPENSTVIGGSAVEALKTESEDMDKAQQANDVEDSTEQSGCRDSSFSDDPLDEVSKVLKPEPAEPEAVKDAEDTMTEQLGCPGDTKSDKSLDEAKPDTLDVVYEAIDVQSGNPESCAIATASNFTVAGPDCLVEQPKPETSNDICVALEEQLPLSVDAMVTEQSKSPPSADPVTDGMVQPADDVPEDVKNQTPVNSGVAGDAKFDTSGSESPDEEVEMVTAPTSPAIQSPQENESSGQGNEETVQPDDSVGAVQSDTDVPKYVLQDEVEGKVELLPASHALAELQGYASSDEVSEEADHTNLSRSELIPEVNEEPKPAEGSMPPMEISAVVEQSNFTVPEADMPDEVKPDPAPAYHAGHEMQETVSADHINEETPPAILPECELGSSISEVCGPTEQLLARPEGSAGVGESKFDEPEPNVLDEVIPETAPTDDAIHVPQEHSGSSQVSEEALKTVLPARDMLSDVSEAHVPVEQQLATAEDSPAAGESISDVPVADFHNEEPIQADRAIHEELKDTSTSLVDEEAHSAILQGCVLGPRTSEVCVSVGEELALQEDSGGVETSKFDGAGNDSQDRVLSETVTEACETTNEQSALREDSLISCTAPGSQLQDEDKPETEDGACEIGNEQLVLLEDSEVSGGLNSNVPVAESPDEVKPETVTETCETVDEQSVIADDSAVPAELNSATADAKLQDEVKSETVSEACENEKEQVALPEDTAVPEELDSTTVRPQDADEMCDRLKEQSPQPEYSAIAENPTCDAVGDKLEDEVSPMEVDEVCENVKEPPQTTQPEDSTVSGQWNLAAEATPVDEARSEAGEVCETVKEPQQPTQPEGSTVSGESKLAAPEDTPMDEARSEDEVCESVKEQLQSPRPEDSTVSGESKLAVPEATPMDEARSEADEVCKTVKERQQLTQPEDSTASGESKLVVPETAPQNEAKTETVEEMTDT